MLVVVALLAFGLAAREWGWISFPIPERKRQTEKVWAHDFGFVGASALWGFHIGLTFMTRITYGGVFVLMAMSLVLADPTYGAIVMCTYWVGRTLPVWLAPRLNWSGPNSSQMPSDIRDMNWLYNRLSGFALLWSGAIAVLLALELSGRS